MMMCKAATRLMSKQLDAPLTARERISLRFHLMLCSACRNCEKQFGMLHRVGSAYNSTIDNPHGGTTENTHVSRASTESSGTEGTTTESSSTENSSTESAAVASTNMDSSGVTKPQVASERDLQKVKEAMTEAEARRQD